MQIEPQPRSESPGELLELAQPHHPGVPLEGVQLPLGLDQQLATALVVGPLDREQHLLDAVETLLRFEVVLLEKGSEYLLVHPDECRRVRQS